MVEEGKGKDIGRPCNVENVHILCQIPSIICYRVPGNEWESSTESFSAICGLLWTGLGRKSNPKCHNKNQVINMSTWLCPGHICRVEQEGPGLKVRLGQRNKMDHIALRKEVTRRSWSGKKCGNTIYPGGNAKISIHAELEGEIASKWRRSESRDSG